MVRLRARPGGERIAAVQARRDAAELLLRRVQLALGDREQAIGVERDPFLERSFCSKRRAPRRNDAARARRQVVLEVRRRTRRSAADASLDASARSPSRCRSSTPPNARGRSSSMNRCVPRRLSRPTLTKMPGRILDVVARRLHQPRHLAQLRQHAARALGQRRVVEQRLPGQAGRDQVAVVLGIALPGADGLQLEQARADVGRRAPAARAAPRRSAAPGSIAASRRAKPPSARTCASIAARLRSSSRSS